LSDQEIEGNHQADDENDSGAPEITEEALSAWISHNLGEVWPEIPYLITSEISPTPDDILIAERLLSSYRRCKEMDEKHSDIGFDIWSSIRKLQESYINVLDGGDSEALAVYLCNMPKQDATIGITQGNGEYSWITQSKDYRKFKAMSIKDKLISFGEAVGALQCECPEQGPWGEHMHADLTKLVEVIEAAVNIQLSPPEIEGALFKIQSRRGLFHDRDLHAQYAAWSMREFAGKGASVCEIGGGAGKAAFWATRFDLGSYVILDLPHINVLQGYYLLKTLSKDKVQLFGEKLSEPVVKVLPHFEKESFGKNQFDMVFTQDSLPEINHDNAVEYIEWASRVSRKWLYSINQEAAVSYNETFWDEADDNNDPRQNIVGNLVMLSRGFKRISRTPYWLRKGYVTELFEVVG